MGKVCSVLLGCVLFAINFINVYSQSCHHVFAGNDTTLCSAGQFQLLGSTDAPSGQIKLISWQPATGLSNPSSLSPILNVSTSSQYILTVNALSGNNLVVNGDFSSGDSAFTTTYVQGTGGQWGILSNEGEYDISTDPALSHNSFPSFGDHTTGNGNMMVINGASFQTPIWCQTVSVLPNTSYDFSAWLATCYSLNPGVLQFSINGNLLGNSFTLTSNTGIWQQFSASWFSGSDTTADICIVNQSTAIGGNDFALDDIFLSEVCSVSDTININLASASQVTISGSTSICPGGNTTLNAAAVNATSFLWNNAATAASISVSDSGLYIVQVTIDSLCTVSDSVLVTIGGIEIDLGNDTVICSGQSIQLNTFAGPSSAILWNSGDTTAFITVADPGIYIASVNSGNCFDSDTIIIYNPDLFSLGNDTVLCNGQQFSINYSFSGTPLYIWNTGQTGTALITDTSGTFILQAVYNSGCIISDTLNVSIADPEIALDDSIVSCSEVVLNAAVNGAVSYLWNTGETSASITVNNSGIYSVFATVNNGCSVSDSSFVTINLLLISLDTTFLILDEGETYQINVIVFGQQPFSYEWTPPEKLSCADCPSPVVSAPADTTYYSVEVTDANGCTGTASLLVVRPECETRIFIPNAFTPNNDGRNDLFTLGMYCPGPFKFMIFNRWGDLVYETTDPDFKWNGSKGNSGRQVPEGTYFYVCNSGKSNLKGTITLFR